MKIPPQLQPLQPWLFQVDPYPDESLSHYLGRFRWANRLSSSHLSAMLGLSAHSVAYWEAPSRQRIPQGNDLQRLSQLLGISPKRLRSMWASRGKQHWPTRLCPQCYGEAPYHQHTWQKAKYRYCQRHQHPLLSGCPLCGTSFPIPAHWQGGQCEYCGLPFPEMTIFQIGNHGTGKRRSPSNQVTSQQVKRRSS